MDELMKSLLLFAEWISDNDFKKYAEGWCKAGGSNGWHCTTEELFLQFFNEKVIECPQHPNNYFFNDGIDYCEKCLTELKNNS